MLTLVIQVLHILMFAIIDVGEIHIMLNMGLKEGLLMLVISFQSNSYDKHLY